MDDIYRIKYYNLHKKVLKEFFEKVHHNNDLNIYSYYGYCGANLKIFH